MHILSFSVWREQLSELVNEGSQTLMFQDFQFGRGDRGRSNSLLLDANMSSGQVLLLHGSENQLLSLVFLKMP